MNKTFIAHATTSHDYENVNAAKITFDPITIAKIKKGIAFLKSEDGKDFRAVTLDRWGFNNWTSQSKVEFFILDKDENPDLFDDEGDLKTIFEGWENIDSSEEPQGRPELPHLIIYEGSVSIEANNKWDNSEKYHVDNIWLPEFE